MINKETKIDKLDILNYCMSSYLRMRQLLSHNTHRRQKKSLTKLMWYKLILYFHTV